MIKMRLNEVCNIFLFNMFVMKRLTLFYKAICYHFTYQKIDTSQLLKIWIFVHKIFPVVKKNF